MRHKDLVDRGKILLSDVSLGHVDVPQAVLLLEVLLLDADMMGYMQCMRETLDRLKASTEDPEVKPT